MPSSEELMQLRHDFNEFLHEVKKSCSLGRPDDTASNRLESRYRELYHGYKSISAEQINKFFSIDEIRAINFLSLGMGNGIRSFYTETAKYFSEDADKTAIAMAEFMKSRKAYDMINKINSKSLTEEEKQNLTTMFGSLLGVEVSYQFVKSVKIEEMGRIFGYALSGLCEKDIKNWNDDSSLRSQYFQNFDDYLYDVIGRSDSKATYRFSNDLENSGAFQTTFNINEMSWAARGTPRGRNLVDHCFVVPGNNERKGVILLGTSTAENVADQHGYSFSCAVLAAKAMADTPLINGKENRYFGFEVKTFSCMAGIMPTTTPEGKVERSASIKSLEVKNKNKVPLNQVEYLARLPLISLFASKDPSPLIAYGLNGLNPIIAGCNTLSDYQELLRCSQVESENFRREMGLYVLKKVAEVSSVLSQDDYYLTIDQAGPQKVMRASISVLPQVINNYFMIFPLKENENINSEEVDILKVISSNFSDIHKKLMFSNTARGLSDIKSLRDTAKKIKDVESIYETAREESDFVSHLHHPKIVFNRDLFNEINSVDAVATKDLKAATEGLSYLFRECKAQPFIEIMKKSIYPFIRNSKRDTSRSFLYKWADALTHASYGWDLDNWEYNGCTRKELLVERSKFLKLNGDHPLAWLVEVADPILTQSGPSGSVNIATRVDSVKMQKEIIPNTIKALVTLSRGAQNEEGIDALKQLAIIGNKPGIKNRSKLK